MILRARWLVMLALVGLFTTALAGAETYDVAGSTNDAGLALRDQNASGVTLHYEMGSFAIDPLEVEGATYQKVSLSGVILPNNAGAPDLPGIGRMIAMPQGASAHLEIISSESIVLQGMELAPAPVIPREPPTNSARPSIVAWAG